MACCVSAQSPIISSTGGNNSQEIKSNQPFGQTFLYTSGFGTYVVSEIRLGLQKDPTAIDQTLTLTLESSWGTTDLTSARVQLSDISTNISWVTFDIPDYELQDGTPYTLRLYSSSDDGKVFWKQQDEDTVPEGSALDSSGIPDSATEFDFEVYAENPFPIAQAPGGNGLGGLDVYKTSSPAGSILPGESIRYTITVQNTNAVEHREISIIDSLPPGLNFVPASVTYSNALMASEDILDQFNNQDYSGDDGSEAWAASSWTEFQFQNGPASGSIRVVSDSQTWNGPAMRIGGTNDNIDLDGLYRSADLSDAQTAHLTFEYRRFFSGTDGGAVVTIDISPDGGNTWITLRSYNLDTSHQVLSESINILPYATPQTRIRFLGAGQTGAGNTAFFYADNIKIEYHTTQFDDPPQLLSRGILSAGESMEISFDAAVDNPFSISNTNVINQVDVTSAGHPIACIATATNNVFNTLQHALNLTQTSNPSTPVAPGNVLGYTLRPGSASSELHSSIIVTNPIPDHTQYVNGSANAGGTFSSNQISWVLGSNTPGVPIASNSSGLCPTTIQLQPQFDTYITEDAVNDNRLTDGELQTKTGENQRRVSIVRFNTSSIPTNAIISKARLSMRTVNDHPEHTSEIYRALTPWDSSEATWAQPTDTTSWANGTGFSIQDYDSSTLHGTLVAAGADTYVDTEVTALVQNWISGSNYGLVMIGSAAGISQAEWTSQNVLYKPYLEITYLTAVSESCNSSGQLWPSKDTYIEADQPNQNEGANPLLFTEPRNNREQYSLVQFDLSHIPTNAIIRSATFDINVSRDRPGQTINLYPLLTDWTEHGATWNQRDGTGSWAAGSFSSADYSATSLGSFSPSSTLGDYLFDFTAQVQDWIANGIPNYGMALIITGTNGRSEHHSRESALTASRPSLYIDWEPASGHLTTELKAESSIATDGATIDVIMTLTSDEVLNSVTPDSTLTINTINGASATLLSGPNPSSAIVGPTGASFVYSYRVHSGPSAGVVSFTGGASGSAYFPRAISCGSIVSPPLTFQVQVNDPLPGTTSHLINLAEISSLQQTAPSIAEVTNAIARTSWTVISDYGLPFPATGSYTGNVGSILSFDLNAPPFTNGTTRYVAGGWTGTGSIPASGSTTNTGAIAIQTNSTITWNWEAEYFLDTGTNANGSVDTPDSWQATGDNVVLTAIPNSGYHFTQWTGDVPPGQLFDNPLTITMDAAKTIAANFATTTASFSQPTSNRDEHASPPQISVQLNAPAPSPITAYYTITGGTASNGVDYTLATGEVSFAVGQTSSAISINIINDNIDEFQETIEFQLTSATNAVLGTSTTHTLTITDDDTPSRISIAGGPYSAPEDAGSQSVSLQLNKPSGKPISVDFNTLDLSATSPADFTAVSGTVSWAAGDQTTQTISIPVIDDPISEGTEAFNLNLFNNVNVNYAGSASTTVLIIDNESPPVVLFAATPYTFDESIANHLIALSLVGVSASNITATVTLTSNSATAGSDFVAVSTNITWLSGETGNKSFPISLIDDAVDERDETMNVSITFVDHATVSGPPTIQATIVDDEATPHAFITTPSPVTVSENNTNVVVNLSLSGVSDRDIILNYQTTNGTAAAGNDYVETSGSLTWLAGETGNKSVTIPLINDAIFEANAETLTFSISAITNAVSSSPSTLGIIMLDNDNPPEVVLTGTPYSTNETNAQLRVTASMIGRADTPVTVDFLTLSGTAQADIDFAQTNGTLNWAAGSTGDQIITINLIDDSLYEPAPESFTLQLTNFTTATPGFTTSDTISLVDDETRPILAFSDALYSAMESDGSAQISVELLGASTEEIRVDFATTDFTAFAGQDYSSVTNTFIWAPTTTGSKTISIPITDDPIDEVASELFRLTLQNPINAQLLTTNAIASIQDDDNPPELTFVSTPYTINEAAGSNTVTIAKSGISDRPVSVEYATFNGTAQSPSDFSATSGVLTWSPLETGNKSFSIPIIDDSIHEAGAETFQVILSNTTNAIITGPVASTVSISNDDLLPSITLMGSPYFVNEAGRNMVAIVQLTGQSDQTITLEYTTIDGSAENGIDYTRVSGTISWLPTETGLRTIEIPIINDTLDEDQEQFAIDFSNPMNASINGNPTAFGNILLCCVLSEFERQ